MLTSKTENEPTARAFNKLLSAGAHDYLAHLESLLTPSTSTPVSNADCERAPGPDRVDILVIAVSSGGSDALVEILTRLPHNFPVPVLIVQHMPKEFTSALAQRLNAKCRISVAEAHSGETLYAGKAWLAPGGKHLNVSSDGGPIRLVTTLDPPENSCRPASDVLFRSAARFYGRHTLALVLTGMGRDGIDGCKEIRKAGGKVLVQDESPGVAWGRPETPAPSQGADQAVPLNEIANAILKRVWEKRGTPTPITAS